MFDFQYLKMGEEIIHYQGEPGDILQAENGSTDATAAAHRRPGSKSKKNLVFNKTFEEDELDAKELMRVLSEVKNGNFQARMSVDKTGLSGKICDTLNDIISHAHNEFEGTGIGLSICKRIAEKHNGFIQVRSRVNEGTTFTVTLPYKQPV